MDKKTMSILSVLVLNFAFAQKKDSLNQANIDEVVITGQFSPQSIDRSIYKVEVIDQAQIKNMAATNVAEVLNQNLNVLITPDRSSGNSSVNIMGLNGQYTKILIDNIPVVSDEGLGNFVDLTKINLNNIERIEVVKGSMGVEYGNNAVAGVINIITKKSSSKKLTGIASVQEETVGNNYDWYRKGNGRHVQNLYLCYNINENWFISADINHNDFQGFQGNQKGYRYFSTDNDGLRGYEWQPKDQLNANAIVKYAKGKTTVYYKANFLNEEINYRNPLIEPLNFAGGERTYIANDRDYLTQRWIHQLNISTAFGRVYYQGDFSYQNQERKFQDYQYDVPNPEEYSRDPKEKYYDTNVLYSRGMFSNFIESDSFDFRIGYELDRTNGYVSSEAGYFSGNNLERTIFNYSNFLSLEWNISPEFSVRPGARLALSDKFDRQFNYSFTAKYTPTQKHEIRGILGSANRFPTFEELFTFMVDANHDIRGNESLNPEKGFSTGLFYDFIGNSNNTWKFNVGFSAMYIQAKDRIDLAIIGGNQYRYINIDDYKSMVFGGNLIAKSGTFSANAGASLMGISQKLQSEGVVSPNDYNFYLEANLAINYSIPTTQTLFALYYKYTGKSNMFTLKQKANLAETTEYILGEVGGFSMMNFTVSQPFFNKHIELAAGIKNIFDATDVKNTVQSGGAHNAAASTQNLFYGRSYFARLTYNF